MKNKVSSFYKEAAAAVDVGLRKYMLNVFSYMCIGLFATAIVAYAVSTSQSLMYSLFATGLQWVVLFAPLAIVFYLSARIAHMSAESAKFWFYLYSATVGASLAPVFVIYTGSSVATAFFVTSAMFLSVVIYGYSTDKDLSGIGLASVMGLFGIIIASIVNLFMRNSMADFIISAVAVVVFTGLTAWDTQTIKSYYFEGDEQEISDKKAIFGALKLYLDFINLFLYALRFLGNRRD